MTVTWPMAAVAMPVSAITAPATVVVDQLHLGIHRLNGERGQCGASVAGGIARPGSMRGRHGSETERQAERAAEDGD